ncbi:MAG: DUF1553 domain-containing protein [Verrucomicrobia bacterium]|nr:DUF1553 domain-containing protein [Verrucomicrobiota bacterium]
MRRFKFTHPASRNLVRFQTGLNVAERAFCFRAVLLVAFAIQPLAVPGAPVSFRNDVMAVLSKAGCNAGTCHGNKNGKGGFKLSLRGQDPDTDYQTLTRDALGRRINSLDPDQSLLLLKPTARVSHEGGSRFHKESEEFQILRRWIAVGMANDADSAPMLRRLEVSPAEAILVEPANRVPLRVQASFSDGTSRDVTALTVYETSNGLAKVSQDGLAERAGFGETTILARYLHLQQPVRLAFVPSRPEFAGASPLAQNYIDEHILAKLRRLRMNPSDLCSDAVFLRRAYLDLLGLLPSSCEAQVFLDDSSPSKRARLIETLLERPEFADFWALKWADVLRNEAHSLDAKGVQNFYHWIRQSIADHKPLDRFVRELLTTRGSTYSNPAANYHRPNRDPATRAKAAAQVFLGVRLQCAECHNHPFDRWTQDDYYDWSSVFSKVSYKVLENKRDIGSDKHEWKGEQVVFASRRGAVVNPRTGQPARPRLLGTAATAGLQDGDALNELAEWLTSPENLQFARVQANRIWFHLMGRGLVEPIDDFRATNPPSHPELLDALARDFIEHGFDLRHLVRVIVASRTYQLSSEPNESNADDEANYSHVLVRRLTAEQLLDAQSQVAGVPLRFAGLPAGLRAAQLPGVRPEAKGQRRSNQMDQFLEIFGKPPRLLTSETERSCECNMSQAFQMISGPTVNELISEKRNRISDLLASGKSAREMIAELHWTALSTGPSDEPLNRLAAMVDQTGDHRAALEDILWGLLNSKEFLFRR